MLRGHGSGLTFWTTEAAEGSLSSRATHWDLAQAPPSPGRLAQVPGGCLPTLPVSQGLVPLRGQSKLTESPAHSSPGAQGLPGSINVGVEVLLRGPARADAIARVVIGEDVTVDACAQANVETAHLAQVHRIAM